MYPLTQIHTHSREKKTILAKTIKKNHFYEIQFSCRIKNYFAITAKRAKIAFEKYLMK